MEKRLWLVLLALVLIISGCGKGDSDTTDGAPPDEEPAEVVETEDSDETFDTDVFDTGEPEDPAEDPATGDPSATGGTTDVAQVLSKDEIKEIARGRLERAIEKIEPFDRKSTTKAIIKERYNIDMEKFPRKPLAPKELQTLFMSTLKLRADEQFPEADKVHVEKQAAEQFPIYKKGDSIKLVLVRGVVQGTIEEVYGDRMKIDGRYVLIKDVRDPSPEAFDVERVEKRRKHYISLNYDQPRNKYLGQLADQERDSFFERHFYIKDPKAGWLRADQVYKRIYRDEAAKKEREYMDEQRFLLKQKIEQELRDEGLWR